MHFWIDKRSIQACGRYRVPLSLSGYGRNCGNYYPKPMVTPVHRFQSIESVTRVSNYHYRAPCPPASVHISNNGIHHQSIRNGSGGDHLNSINNLNNNANTPQNWNSASPTTAVTKWSVWVILVVLTFFLAWAKYFFQQHKRIENIVFYLLLIILTILFFGAVSFYAHRRSNSSESDNDLANANPGDQQLQEIDDGNTNVHLDMNQEDVTSPHMDPMEMPPPPYHIAIMLAPRNDLNDIQVIHDSSPPSYEKAIT